MNKEVIFTEKAPKAIGPYDSQEIRLCKRPVFHPPIQENNRNNTCKIQVHTELK